MVKLKTVIHKDIELSFDPVKHKYVDSRGTTYTSVTTFIGSHFPEFNSREVAEKCVGSSKYEGMSVEDIIEMWEKNKHKASKYGTKVHDAIENYLKTKKPLPFLDGREEALQTFLDVFLTRYDFIEAEKMIFSQSWGLSGTVDAIFKNKETGKILIADWKTNEKISKSDYGNFGIGGLDNFGDSKFNRYSLQLTTYAAILNNEDYMDTNDAELAIFHVKQGSVERIEVDKKEIELSIMLVEDGRI